MSPSICLKRRTWFARRYMAVRTALFSLRTAAVGLGHVRVVPFYLLPHPHPFVAVCPQVLCPVHRVKHLIGSKGSVVNKIMTRTGTGIVVEAEVIPAFTRVNKSSVDAQIVSIKGSKEGTIIAQVCLHTHLSTYTVCFAAATSVAYTSSTSRVHGVLCIVCRALCSIVRCRNSSSPSSTWVRVYWKTCELSRRHHDMYRAACPLDPSPNTASYINNNNHPYTL